MAFYRNILHNLNSWRKSKNRKPLVLRGARQTGKTTIVKSFGESFDTFIYLNLEKASDCALFDNELAANELFQYICLEKNIVPQGEVLLFIDEIQNSPKAVSQLRYFYEDLPKLFVISAGSLLEVMMDRHKISFPVGRVEYRYLYPLSFDEFLSAIGETVILDYYLNDNIPSFGYDKINRLFRLYSFIGGMPEVVSRYVESGDISQLSLIYESLITSYQDDATKYAKNESSAQILRHVIEMAPFNAGQRITFEHFGKSNYKSREIGESLKMLERAMLLYLRYPVTGYQLPLQQDFKLHPRLQFVDTGLLNYRLGLIGAFFSNLSLSDAYNGMIAEHIVGQELLAADNMAMQKPLFWVREKKQSNAELDFIVVNQGLVIPVEVKSGKSGTLRSLHAFIDEGCCDFAVRLYSGPVGTEQTQTPSGKKYRLINLPLFYAGKLRMMGDFSKYLQ